MVDNYYDQITPGPVPVPMSRRYIAKETAEEQDYLGAAMEEAMIPYALGRMWDRRGSQFEDTTWEPDDALGMEMKALYTESEEKYLRKSGSREEFLARRTYISEDQKRLSAMASGGWKGVGAMLAFSVIDPVNIGVSAATGGIGYLQKGGTLVRAAKLAVSSGLENVALDSMLMQGNTQFKATDLIVSFGAGAVVGSGIGMLKRAEAPGLGREADAADAAASADADSHVINRITEGADSSKFEIKKMYPEADAVSIQAKVRDFENTLVKDINGRLHPKTAKDIKARIKEVKKKIYAENDEITLAQRELTELRDNVEIQKSQHVEEAKRSKEGIESAWSERIAKQEARLAKVEEKIARKGADKKTAAKLYKEETELAVLKKNRDAEIASTREMMVAKIRESEGKLKRAFAERTEAAKTSRRVLETNLADYQGRLERGARAKMSAQRYKQWKGMTTEQKIAQAYQDGEIPNVKSELRRQMEGLGPMRPVKAVEAMTENAQRSGAPEASTVGKVEEGGTGTAGAMRADEKVIHKVYDLEWDDVKKISAFAEDGTKVPESLVASRLKRRSKFTDALHSAHAIVSNSKDFSIRGFAYHLFEAPQGGQAAKVTVAARVKNYSVQIRSAMRNRLNEGLEEWGKENGLSRYATLMRQENFKAYNKSVMIEIKKPGTYDSEAIRKGAAGVKDQLEAAGIIRKDAGEAGFDNMEFDKSYVPIIMDDQAIKNALRNHSEFRVMELLSLGYQRGAFKLDKALADRIAEGYITRSKNHTLTMRDAIRMNPDKDIEDVGKKLKAAGVDQDTIDDFLDIAMDKEMKQHMSNRAKKSLHPDLSVELNGLKFIDLVDHDLPKLLESYTRDAAGGAAFAKMGFKTRREVLDMLTLLEKGATNNGFLPADIGREIQVLRDGVDLAYGRSLNTEAHSGFVRNLSRLRDATGLLRLQFVGAASIPELARVTAQRSLSSVMDACPDLGAFRSTKNLREGGKYSGQFKRPDLREIELAMGYTGEDHVLYPNGLRADDLEEADISGRLGTWFDNAIAQGRRLQEVASGFRLIQGTGEKIAVRSLAGDIKKWALKGGKSLSDENINRAGWSDGFLGDLKKFMNENPATDTFNGKTVDLFNFGKMAPDMQERLQIGMHRLVMADMQRPYIGETPIFMHKWLGQTLTQFRSFSIMSLEKQLVHDIKHDKAMGAIMAMHSAMLGYMALGISSMQKNIGKDDALEKIENDMTGKNAVIGVVNRMGQLASWGIGQDMLATMGVLPDNLLGSPGEYGARAFTTGSVPTLGLITDAGQAMKAIPDLIKGKADTSDTLKEIQDVLPFAKAIGINQGFNYLKSIE